MTAAADHRRKAAVSIRKTAYGVQRKTKRIAALRRCSDFYRS
jgi:hypothetical protein